MNPRVVAGEGDRGGPETGISKSLGSHEITSQSRQAVENAVSSALIQARMT